MHDESAVLALSPGGRPPAKSVESLREAGVLTAYAVRKQDVGDLTLRLFGHGPATVLDEQRSPVIAVSRSVLSGSRLSPGRFYLVTRFWAQGTLIEKPPDFLGWADRVFRSVKRRLVSMRSLSAYCGKEAAEFLARSPDAARGG